MGARAGARPGAVALLALLTACGAARPETPVARRLGGERTLGVFVSPSAYEWFIRGELAANAARWQEAAAAYRLALASADEDPLVFARLALALERARQPAEADAAIARALAIDPDSEAAYLARGEVAERRGDLRGAVAAFERARTVAPGSEAGPLRLAEILRRIGATKRADAVLDRLAREGGPASATAARARLAAALAGDDAEAAGEAALALLEVAPVRRSDVRDAAARALEAGRIPLAARLVAALPTHDADLALRVRVALARGARDDAEGLLATATPDALGGAVATARLWLATGRADRAYELAREAVALEPGPESECVVGDAALAAGLYDEAATAYARVPRGASGHPAALRGLADALTRASLPALAADVRAHAPR